MKKKRKDFESRFWSGSRKHSRIKLIETFFQFNDLVTAKQILSNIMIYTGKKKKSVTEDSAAIFHFHQALRSFVRACCSNALKENKSTVTTLTENHSPLMQGSLSDEEYLNPTLVFQRAFEEFSIKDFDYYIAVAVYFSMGTSANAAESKMIATYIQLVKMLDAAYLLHERDIKK